MEKNPSHTIILGCSNHPWLPHPKYWPISQHVKFQEKMHFLIKVDFWPYHNNIYPQSGLYDSLHSSYMSWNHQKQPHSYSVWFGWGCSTYPGDQLTPLSPTVVIKYGSPVLNCAMLIMCVTTNVNIPCNHTMSYHAFQQPSLMHNYYEDFGDCLLIDNGRVTPPFQKSICANFLSGLDCWDSVFILKVILHGCITETFKTIRACYVSFIDNL